MQKPIRMLHKISMGSALNPVENPSAQNHKPVLSKSHEYEDSSPYKSIDSSSSGRYHNLQINTAHNSPRIPSSNASNSPSAQNLRPLLDSPTCAPTQAGLKNSPQDPKTPQSSNSPQIRSVKLPVLNSPGAMKKSFFNSACKNNLVLTPTHQHDESKDKMNTNISGSNENQTNQVSQGSGKHYESSRQSLDSEESVLKQRITKRLPSYLAPTISVLQAQKDKKRADDNSGRFAFGRGKEKISNFLTWQEKERERERRLILQNGTASRQNINCSSSSNSIQPGVSCNTIPSEHDRSKQSPNVHNTGQAALATECSRQHYTNHSEPYHPHEQRQVQQNNRNSTSHEGTINSKEAYFGIQDKRSALGKVRNRKAVNQSYENANTNNKTLDSEDNSESPAKLKASESHDSLLNTQYFRDTIHKNNRKIINAKPGPEIFFPSASDLNDRPILNLSKSETSAVSRPTLDNTPARIRQFNLETVEKTYEQINEKRNKLAQQQEQEEKEKITELQSFWMQGDTHTEEQRRVQLFRTDTLNFFEINQEAPLTTYISTDNRIIERNMDLKSTEKGSYREVIPLKTLAVLAKFNETNKVLQPDYMKDMGSMCFTEFWSDKQRSDYFYSMKGNIKTVKVNEDNRSLTPWESVYRPSKLKNQKKVSDKIINQNYSKWGEYNEVKKKEYKRFAGPGDTSRRDSVYFNTDRNRANSDVIESHSALLGSHSKRTPRPSVFEPNRGIRRWKGDKDSHSATSRFYESSKGLIDNTGDSLGEEETLITTGSDYSLQQTNPSENITTRASYNTDSETSKVVDTNAGGGGNDSLRFDEKGTAWKFQKTFTGGFSGGDSRADYKTATAFNQQLKTYFSSNNS